MASYPSYRHSGSRRLWRIIRWSVIGLVIGGYVVAAVLFVLRQSEPKVMSEVKAAPKPTSPASAVDAIAQLQKINNQRKADAYALYYATGNYYNANNGAYPTGFATGALIGQPNSHAQPLALGHYTALTVQTGAQAPVTTDSLHLVTAAACAATGSATIASSRSFAFVVQYALQNQDGTFTPLCLRL